MKSSSFKAGDLVAVIGGTVEKDNDGFKKTAQIATVVEAGAYELFVKIMQSYSTYVIKVPKKACQKRRVEKGVSERRVKKGVSKRRVKKAGQKPP